MKIRQITLENFGVYKHKRLDFGAAPLVLVYGPNESGKTTAMNGIRQALFGFPAQTPYLVGPGMQATVEIETTENRKLEFLRRKGNKNALTGTLDGTNITAEDIEALLCNTSLHDYESLFGFTLTELQKGEDLLKKTPLAQVLAGGGLAGITALQKLQTELATSLSELFKRTGKKTPINALLLEIRQTKEKLTAALILPQKVTQFRDDLKQTTELRGQIQQQSNDAFRTRAAAQKLLDALPHYQQLQVLNAELGRINLPEQLTPSLANQWNSLQQRSVQLKQETTQLEQQGGQLASELKQLGALSPLTAASQDVEQLGNLAKMIPQQRRQLADHREQVESTQQACRKLLDSLQLADFTDQLSSFSISEPDRVELETLSRQFTEISSSIVAADARLTTLNDSLAQETPGDAPLIPSEVIDQLDALAEQRQSLERKLGEANKRASEAAHDAQLVALTTRLNALLPPEAPLGMDFRVPAAGELSELQQETLRSTQQLAVAQEKLESLRGETQRISDVLDSTSNTAGFRLVEQLAKHTAQRDKQVADWIDELQQNSGAPSVDNPTQAQRLRDLQQLHKTGDALQQELLNSAESVAEYELRRNDLHAKQTLLETSESELAERDFHLRQLNERLVSLFAHVPVRVADVQTMVTWHSDYAAWQLKQADVLERNAECKTLETALTDLRGRLTDIWPAESVPPDQTPAIRKSIEHWQAAAREAAGHKQRQQIAAQNCDSTQRGLAKLQLQQSEIGEKLQTWINAAPAQDNWPVERVTQLIDTLERLRAENENLSRYQQRVREIETELTAFDTQAAEVALLCGLQPPNAQPEIQAQSWLSELHQSRSENDRRVKLQATIEHTQTLVQNAAQQDAALEAERLTICQTIGNTEATDVASMIDKLQVAGQVKEKIAETKAVLKSFSADQDLDSISAACKQSDDAELELAIREHTRNIDQLEDQRSEAEQQIGQLELEIAQLAKNDLAQRLQQDLQNQRGKLADLSAQWLVQSTSEHILQKAIAKFAAENEPTLLKFARQYLSDLTGGRYVNVQHDSADDQFVVRTESDAALPPSQLSTGTREQLYLALRMAYITNHCQDREPLPVMMDDCFVNFDDDRMGHAVKSISGWDDNIQTILFSCHGRMLDIVSDVVPDAVIIRLDEDASLPIPSRPKKSASSNAAKPTKKRRKKKPSTPSLLLDD